MSELRDAAFPPRQSYSAEPRAPYGRHTRRELAETAPEDGRELQPYRGETYYEQPALKPGHYKWLIVGYFYIGGVAGGAQILATVADLAGNEEDRVVVRHGRHLALAGAIAGPAMLIADLHSPGRFYNMLRIFRRTSPMSIGSWTLAAFGSLSGVATVAQILEDATGDVRWRRLGTIAGVPAAGIGAVVAYYTGTLLTATSVPLWAAVPRHLPALFGASAGTTAAAALTLSAKAAGAPEPVTDQLEKFDAVAAGAEAAILAATDRQWRDQGVDEPVRKQPLSTAYLAGVAGLGIALPLAINGVQLLTGRKSTTATMAAAVATLAGGFLLRSVVVFGGRKSAESPHDYFHFTQRPAEPISDRLPQEQSR